MTDEPTPDPPTPGDPTADPGFSQPPDVLPLASAEELGFQREPEWPRYVVTAGVVVYAIFVVFGVASGSFELLDPIPLIPLLGYLAYQLARRVAQSERDPAMVLFVMAAFVMKMVGALVRSIVVAQIYGNRSDAEDYHLWGQYLAPRYRSFNFSANVGPFSGTGFMRSLTGMVYTFTGASKISGSIFFSFLSFVGLLLLWRAFRRCVPNGLGRRYALLVLFLPSMLYWPSALGKDAFAVFCLGIVSYGVARVLTRSLLPGLGLFALGMFGLAMLRPHVGLTVFCGVVLAAAVGKSARPSARTPIVRMVVFGALLVLGLFLVSSTEQFFGVESLNNETVNQTLSDAEGRTSDAGSSFSAVSMSNPANAPLAIVTVLYRPAPFEATSAVAMVSALEGVFLLGLTCKSFRRLRSIPRLMRRQPYVAYCVGIMFTFIYAFSAFSNFGILSRQRCQVMPFFFVLLCLPEWRREGIASTEEALEGRDQPVASPYAGVEGPPNPYAHLEGPDPYAHQAPVERSAPDPYVHSLDDDPYARFADPPRGRRRRGD